MGKPLTQISPEQADLLRNAPLFFVASAAPDVSPGPDGTGRVNLSPKGSTPLHVLDANRVAYLDFAGSGNETARHAGLNGPVTVMVCSFEPGDAAIVRLYGTARAEPIERSALSETLLKDLPETPPMKNRQVIEIEVEKAVTSCGYGVPVLEFVRERRREDRGRRYK